MTDRFRSMFARLALGAVLPVLGLLSGSAEAAVLFTPPAGTLAPGTLYARAMQTSNGKMYATFEQYTTGIATFPIYESTDNGETWKKVGDVKDTHKNWG